MRVCHITTAHLPEDIRIFKKECVSIADAGHDVHLVETGDSYVKNGVNIHGIGRPEKSRIKRILCSVPKAYKIALSIDADIYQIHDPELIQLGLKLLKRDKKVVFDSHEDYPTQITQKNWIPVFLRKPLARIYTKYEKKSLSKYDGVVGVTPHQVERLKNINENTIMVSNFPKELLTIQEPTFLEKRIVFPGMVYDAWCIDTILEAIEPIDDLVFSIRSTFDISEEYRTRLVSKKSWKKVDYQTRQPHDKIMELLSKSMCGMAISKYGPNVNWTKGTLGNTKLFEYMQAGIPVICTDLELWKDIVEKNKCGICVKPDDVQGIRKAIEKIVSDPVCAKEMGENGRKAIKEKYNWEVEAEKLLKLYDDILRI